jgi:endonuclease/exonuclease/phosphatase family protein
MNFKKLISKMNNNTRPDILGICEIENRPVVEKLVGSLASLFNHDYKIIHASTQDEEGLICSHL